MTFPVNRELSPVNESSTFQYSDLFQFTYYSVEELLGFIERHFTKYFDQDTKAPESYIVLAADSDVVKNLGTLQEHLKRLHTESNLLDLALSPVKKFIENIPNNQIT